jgi:H+-transporting ATPase
MLEATVVLQLAVGERLEAAMVAALLLFNVALGVFQESRANAALDLLKRRLAPKARIRRDGRWQERPATELVPGDIVQLSLGGVIPADLKLISGALLLDQSMLTGESIPVETGPGQTAYAGALVRRGEAIAEVSAIGTGTYFGRTAQLVRTAHVESSEQQAVLSVVRVLTVVNFAIVVGMVTYAHTIGMETPRIIPLVLTALLSAVPVALPATFTLASALGAKLLALRGVLLTRLSALHEAAMIDVLCVDKTGTLTENQIAVATVQPLKAGWNEADVLALAAAASSTDGQDAIDTAIRSMVSRTLPAVIQFTPFDPATKTAEAVVASDDGGEIRVVKGALTAITGDAPMIEAAAEAQTRFAAAAYRTIAVAAGRHKVLELVGLIAFSDPPRADSPALLAELRALGVESVMITGDSPATAATIADAIGLHGAVCPQGRIPESVSPDDYAVYAGMFPEDKFRLVLLSWLDKEQP